MLLDAVIARISGQLDSLAQSQQSTQAGATHEETRAEDPKDTRATEASYLARGLAERVEQLRGELDRLRALSLRDFGADSPVGLGALVRVEEEHDEEEAEKSGVAGGLADVFSVARWRRRIPDLLGDRSACSVSLLSLGQENFGHRTG